MKERRGITARSVFIGIFLVCLCVLIDHYSINVVHGSFMAIDHMPVAGISLFFILLIFLHILITIVKKPLRLSSSELLIIYIMGFVGCSVSSMGLGSQILPILAAPHYYATAENRWEELILPHIRSWLIPQDREAIRQFFEGAPEGTPIPWGVWIRPLLFWTPFLLSLYVVMICIPLIMQRQWIEKERLQFPLAQLPLEMIKQDEHSKHYTFFRNKLMWLGFAIPFIISSLNGLNHYFPAIPRIELAHEVPTFRHTQLLRFRISFPIIGFLFLVNLDVAFGLWFFALIFHVIGGWLKMIGIAPIENLGIYGSPDVIFNHAGTGALVVFVIYGLWMARAHLKEVFLKAFTRRASSDEDTELLSYRSTVFALIICTIFMVVWLSFSGLPPFLALLFVILALIIFYGITKIVIEAGVPTLISPGIAAPQLVSSVGTLPFGSSGLASLALSHIYSADIRTFPMSAAANSLKIIETIKEKKRLIFPCMLLAIVVSIVTALVVDLHLAYTYGGINLNRWFFIGGPQAPFRYIQEKILDPEGPNIAGWGYKTIGGVIMVFFMFMRMRFLWWPLHPIGWTIGSAHWIQVLWFSIFIAWLLKGLILRYGGPKIYRNARPFFLGLVLGQYVVALLWFIIDLITGMTGNRVFWI